MKTAKLVGIVVLYYPDYTEVIKNISSYRFGLDKLIVWNNTPGEDQFLPSEMRLQDITYIHPGENKGLGVAYNFAADYARDHGYTHLLLMDQDSCFCDDSFSRYIQQALCGPEHCLFSPNHKIEQGVVFPTEDKIYIAHTAFSSGTLYPVGLFSTVGRFRDDYFIDFIDIEYCLRARQNHINICVVTDVILFHHLGDRKRRRSLFGLTLSASDYSPMRTYYILRNGIHTYLNYPKAKSPLWVFFWVLKKLAKVILFDTSKSAMLRAYCRGVKDGVGKKTGRHPFYH